MRWLALDIGSQRVGVAVCDDLGRVASALPALEYAGSERLAEAIAELAGARDAGGVVVGVPVTRSGHGPGERRVSKVVAALRERLDVPVETFDETGTTTAARALLEEAGVPRRRWPELVDSTAARLILEGFLENPRARRLDR